MQFQVASDRGYLHEHSREYGPVQNDKDCNNYIAQEEIAKIPSSFNVQEYPLECSQTNPFCPLCKKFLSKTQTFLVYQSTQKRKKYLAHRSCLQQSDGKQLSLAQSPEAKLQSIAFLNQVRSLALGGKEFYFEVQIFHPLGGCSMAKLWTKLKSIGNVVTWDFKSHADTDCYSPNIVAFPFPDFQISVTLLEMGERQSKYEQKATISVGRLRGNQLQFVKAYTPFLEITMRIVGNKDQQLRIIDEMNLKYPYPLDTNTPLVQIVRVQVKLPPEDSDDQDQEDSRRNFSITEINSEKSSYRDHKFMQNSEALSQRSFDRQKVDLQKLISSEKLGQFVRQNTQSRVFQGWLGEATPREIDEVISSLWEQFPELITHEYANYMIQKLIGVCSLPQRIKIVERIQSDIPGIVRNKQGTHTLQTLIKLFSTAQEFRLVVGSIKNSFLTLSQHPNATHFLQKMIELFPLAHTICFIETVTQDFLSYAVDKHAMCVIKQIIKQISQSQGTKSEEISHELRKRMVHVVNFNIDHLIGDPYGNYIVQFCFQYFGEAKCAAITERIIARFVQFSLQKYSNAVVFKCVSNFWTDKEALDKLKNALTPQAIQQLYRNKDSNKILLQVVERHQESSLREKIQRKLMLNEPTKFNHDRWGVALGSRSGTVGGWTSFTDAVKKPTKKRKKYNNDR